jgi:hypothetical protein
MNDPQELVDRYVAIWNESDAGRRSQAVAELWSDDAVHILQPPEEVREAAANLDMAATFHVRGHAQLEARVRRAHEQFVAGAGNTFRAKDDGASVGATVKFRWEMVTDGGEVAGAGSSSWSSMPTAGFRSTTSSSRASVATE